MCFLKNCEICRGDGVVRSRFNSRLSERPLFARPGVLSPTEVACLAKACTFLLGGKANLAAPLCSNTNTCSPRAAQEAKGPLGPRRQTPTRKSRRTRNRRRRRRDSAHRRTTAQRLRSRARESRRGVQAPKPPRGYGRAWTRSWAGIGKARWRRWPPRGGRPRKSGRSSTFS